MTVGLSAELFISEMVAGAQKAAHPAISPAPRFSKWIIALAPFVREEMTFRKRTARGENSFAKGATRTASNAFVQVLS